MKPKNFLFIFIGVLIVFSILLNIAGIFYAIRTQPRIVAYKSQIDSFSKTIKDLKPYVFKRPIKNYNDLDERIRLNNSFLPRLQFSIWKESQNRKLQRVVNNNFKNYNKLEWKEFWPSYLKVIQKNEFLNYNVKNDDLKIQLIHL